MGFLSRVLAGQSHPSPLHLPLLVLNETHTLNFNTPPKQTHVCQRWLAAVKEEQGALPPALGQHVSLIPEDSHIHYQQNIKSIHGCDFTYCLGTATVEEITPPGLAVLLAA